MWEKVVLNLLSNAFKFTHQGHIEVRLRRCGETVELMVRDTGTGMPEQELPRIFERFHRIKGARGRTHEGTGIGLALVEELVHLHGGTIGVESALGKGTVFTVRLPMSAEPLPPYVATGREPVVERTSASAFVEEAVRWLPLAGQQNTTECGARGRIVLADDNADMRAYVSRLLAESGYQVEAVADGEAALAACLPAPPALVVADVMMPVLDGLALVRRLRASERTAALPILLLSARAGEEARIEGLRAGADDYVVKPFGQRELLARVDAAVRLARTRAEAADRERRIAVLARLAGVVDTAMDAIVSVDVDQRVVHFNPAAEKMFDCSVAQALGQPLDRFIPECFRAANAERKNTFTESGDRCRDRGWRGALSAMRGDGREFPIEASISEAEVDGQKLLTVILRDITERKQAEDTQRLLIAELDHRVKNTLATVQAIALQTLTATTDPAAFAESFNGRLQALACAHTLLTRSGWRGAELRALVREQLALGAGEDARIVCAGPSVVLEPQTALHVGLVLHELGTNACKYGSLSVPQGHLDVRWRVQRAGVARELQLNWVESGGPTVRAPARQGFGTLLIRRSLKHGLGGEAGLSFAPSGLTCAIRLPLEYRV
jgi:PAS domain S-box-containing protein